MWAVRIRYSHYGGSYIYSLIHIIIIPKLATYERKIDTVSMYCLGESPAHQGLVIYSATLGYVVKALLSTAPFIKARVYTVSRYCVTIVRIVS